MSNSASILIENVKIYSLSQPVFTGWLLTEGKTIKNFGAGAASEAVKQTASTVIDGGGKHLLPGFIDAHTHGCLSHCTMDADPETILKMAERHVSHGVTTFLPTTMTGTKENIVRAVKAVQTMIGKRGSFSKIEGTYLEGPFFNNAKCGAQNPEFIRRGTIDEAKAYLDAGTIKVIAMAPEYPENLETADFFAAHGVTIAAGHTNAAYQDLVTGLDHGFSEITHLFNGMGGFSHREPSTIGGALTLDGYCCEMICDNVHSHPAAQNLAWRAKGNKRIMLITDSIRPSGLPDGTYEFSKFETFVVSKNGTNLRLLTGALAGSGLTMDMALRNFTKNSGASLSETWRCSSYNAAVNIGISDKTGSIEKGKLADLVLIDDDYTVDSVYIEGEPVFKRAQPEG